MLKFPMGVRMPFLLRFWWVWELLAFILVGYWVGFLWAFGLILLGSLFGFLLIRRQGAIIAKQMKQNPMMGAFAMMNAVQNSMILLSGFLFMIPGFLTDIIALICLIPFCRRSLINKLLGLSLGSFTKKSVNEPFKSSEPNTIEGECWQEKDKDK